jgi:hypothetical protein
MKKKPGLKSLHLYLSLDKPNTEASATTRQAFVHEAPSGVTERPWEIDDAVNVLKDWKKTLAKQPTHHHLHSITGTVYWPADD